MQWYFNFDIIIVFFPWRAFWSKQEDRLWENHNAECLFFFFFRPPFWYAEFNVSSREGSSHWWAEHLLQEGWGLTWVEGLPYLLDKLETVSPLSLWQWETVSEVAKMSSGKFYCWTCTFFPSWKWAKLLKVIAAIFYYSDSPTCCGTKRYKACWRRNFQKIPEEK